MDTRWVDAASRRMPRVTARIAAAAMLAPGRRMRVRPEQRETMTRAARETLIVGRHRVAVYRWGTGERRMLLVHGWQGRAAQFAEVVSRFEESATIVAFDAPAHGGSRGITADIGMWIQTIRALDAQFDFDVVVAHSFGGLAALRARLAGLVRAQVVAISAPPSTGAVMHAYATQVGLTDAVASRVNEALARRLGPVMASIAMGSRADAPAGASPILVIHDRADRAVPVVAARTIESTWPDAATLMLTDGLGHNRILAAPPVLDAIASFAADASHADASAQAVPAA